MLVAPVRLLPRAKLFLFGWYWKGTKYSVQFIDFEYIRISHGRNMKDSLQTIRLSQKEKYLCRKKVISTFPASPLFVAARTVEKTSTVHAQWMSPVSLLLSARQACLLVDKAQQITTRPSFHPSPTSSILPSALELPLLMPWKRHGCLTVCIVGLC